MEAHSLHHTLLGLEVGTVQHFGSLTMVPLLAATRATGEGNALDYLTLSDALAAQRARVTEVSDAGSVPDLIFENLSNQHVLLVDGEELVGAKQNRVLNLTILVGPGRKIAIPVSCVEQGRWRQTSSEFSSGDNALFAKARASKMESVSESIRSGTGRRSDQGEVWQQVSEKAAMLKAHSRTDAMSDLYQSIEQRHARYRQQFTPVPGQVGAVFIVSGTPQHPEDISGLELFDAAATFSRMFPKLLGSFAMEAIARLGEAPSANAANVAEPALDDSSKAHLQRSAAEMIARLASAPTEHFKALGEGEDVRITSPQLIAGGLLAKGRLIHLAAFGRDTVKARRRGRVH